MKQCALVLGNNSYQDSALKNAVNDATDIASKLGELGFTCVVSTNATHKEMDRNLSDFSKQLEVNEVGVFFFAGHGMQIDGENYLAAVDTLFESELDAKFSCLPLNKVIQTMEASGVRTCIIILDACRNNPYERRWRSNALRGLAPVYAPKGMIIGYATSPGQVASDGNGRNGAFTEAILSHISHQDLNIESFFKRVRNTLSSSTNGKQISWEHTSLMGDYSFNQSRSSINPASVYSDSALADGEYLAMGPLGEIIKQLKSHNFYVQNPAMGLLTVQLLEDSGKDACFVLGRNIYQSSCGGSFEAEAFIKNLGPSLSAYSESTRLHVLNGMLFEIYFDSRGLKRKRVKAAYFDEVLSLEEDPIFQDSFEFIQLRLKPYTVELFYIPGSKTEVCVDVVIERKEGSLLMTKICLEGQNVLYNDSGDGYFDPSQEFMLSTENRITLKPKLVAALATPFFRLKVNFTGTLVGGDEKFETPGLLNLQRMATK